MGSMMMLQMNALKVIRAMMHQWLQRIVMATMMHQWLQRRRRSPGTLRSARFGGQGVFQLQRALNRIVNACAAQGARWPLQRPLASEGNGHVRLKSKIHCMDLFA